MLSIKKITSDTTVDFAAEELKKYLRMMMPECGDIKISYTPDAKDGFRLGLMQDFGLDTSDAEDTLLDDILYIDCDEQGGVIAGSNPRSVLLSVYEYFRRNGCRWLMPGVDGEYIPMQDIKPVKYRYKPSLRFRGWCNEGGEFQQCMLDAIDFAPKVGINVFMLEFQIPSHYYNGYYQHKSNSENRPEEPVTHTQVLQWKRQCESEIAKRGFMFHDIGHGWTVDSFGISSAFNWNKVDDSIVPEENRQYLAMLNGERKLYRGQPACTNFCMSNRDARKKVVDYVSNYAEGHSNSDYLHVWLADASKNHCECDECRKKTPSDWTMVLMNELDEELTARGLDTRIVFCAYVDTTWAPLTEMIKNQDRFALLLAPITRSYLSTLPEEKTVTELKPFVLNKITLPETLEEYLAHHDVWREKWHGCSIVYEYHFCMTQFSDIGTTQVAARINEDVKAYQKKGLSGIIEDGTQRAFFPNGLPFYTYARTLFDTTLSFEDILEDYFSSAYGEDWKLFRAYLDKLGKLFDYAYLEGEKSGNAAVGRYYNPEYAKTLDALDPILEEGRALIEKHYNSDRRLSTVSVRLLEYHQEFCKRLAKAVRFKALGKEDKATEAFEEFRISFGKREVEIQSFYDHYVCFAKYNRMAANDKAKLENLTENEQFMG